MSGEWGGLGSVPSFGVVLRGYERREVDKHIDKLLRARNDGQPLSADAARPKFTLVLRGYDPREVDDYIERLASR